MGEKEKSSGNPKKKFVWPKEKLQVTEKRFKWLKGSKVQVTKEKVNLTEKKVQVTEKTGQVTERNKSSGAWKEGPDELVVQ